MSSPSVITPQKLKPQLEKAKLLPHDGGVEPIELMFNPSEISFSRSVKWQQDPGNRGTSLLPKVNFSGVEPYQFTLKQLIFDTYETKTSVMEKYIDKIKKGVETIDSKPDTRPPVYKFVWQKEYFFCVMTSLTYTLTMFLTDGTPVRAMVDISLQEVDKNNIPGGTQSAASAQQRQNNPQSASLFPGGGDQTNPGTAQENPAAGQPGQGTGEPKKEPGKPGSGTGEPKKEPGKPGSGTGEPKKEPVKPSSVPVKPKTK